MSRMLPHHARDKSRLAPRRLDFLFQKAMRVFSDISSPRIGPGPASIVAGASGPAGFVALPPLQLETMVVTAEPVDRGFDRTVMRFDHSRPAHARDAATILDAGWNAALQPADCAARSFVRIVETPGPAAPVALAHQGAIRRIA